MQRWLRELKTSLPASNTKTLLPLSKSSVRKRKTSVKVLNRNNYCNSSVCPKNIMGNGFTVAAACNNMLWPGWIKGYPVSRLLESDFGQGEI